MWRSGEPRQVNLVDPNSEGLSALNSNPGVQERTTILPATADKLNQEDILKNCVFIIEMQQPLLP